MTGRSQWSLTALALVAVFLLVARALLSGNVFPVWDADSQAAPWQMLIADHARAGRLLLWNPWTDAGSPDFAEPQIGALSPVTILFGLITGGSLPGYMAYWLFVWMLGGLGILVLARHLKSPVWAGFIASLGFMFSGFYAGHAQHMSHLHAISWLPWILWRFDVSLQRRSRLPTFQAGALWGLSALAGYPGLIMIGGLFCFLWAIGRSACGFPERKGNSEKTPVSFSIPAVTILAITGLIVMAPAYTGFLLECQGFSGRAGALSLQRAASNSLHPGALATLTSPHLATLCLTNPGLWTYTDISSCSLYLGPLVIVFAVSSLLSRPRDTWRWWLLGIATLSLLISVGWVLPFHKWFYIIFPPARYFRHPAIFRDFAMLCFILMSLSGMRDVEERPHKTLNILVIITPIISLIALLIYFLTAHDMTDPVGNKTFAICHVLLAWIGISLIAWLMRLQIEKSRVVILALVAAFAVADASFAFGLSSPLIYTTDPDVAAGWGRIRAEHSSNLDLTAQKHPRVLTSDIGPDITNKNLPLKIPVFRGYTAIINTYHERWAADTIMASFVIGESRTWFSTNALFLPLHSELYDDIRSFTIEHMALPMVLHEPEDMKTQLTSPPNPPAPKPKNLPLASRIPVDINTYTPDKLIATVNCPAEGSILFTERWAPGWKAKVNNKPVKIWGADLIFRGIEVPAGENTIEFSYRPFGYPYLLIVSWAVLIMALASAVMRTGERGKSQ